MKKRLAIIVTAFVAAAVLVLGGATLAFGGPGGLIYDEGEYFQPGSLDDGKDLLPQTKITLEQAVADAQRAASGRLGQVDLERYEGRVVYMVDVGGREVRVDAADGSIAAVSPRD